MICYQTRYLDGVFIGTAMAEPDPEVKDRMVLPGACVATPPPSYGAGQQARWFNDSWIIENSEVVFITNEIPPEGVTFVWDGIEITTTNVKIPEMTDRQTATWNGKEWLIENLPEPEPAPVLTPIEKIEALGLTVDDLKALIQ